MQTMQMAARAATLEHRLPLQAGQAQLCRVAQHLPGAFASRRGLQTQMAPSPRRQPGASPLSVPTAALTAAAVAAPMSGPLRRRTAS